MKYYSRIDWWVYGCMLLTTLCTLPFMFITGWSWLIFGIFIISFIFEYLAFSGIWYEIHDNELHVYMMFKPTVYPIDKIESIKYVTSVLSSAALSTRRVAIRFSDNNVLKSRMPLEISPKNREDFIKHLQTINQDIIVK